MYHFTQRKIIFSES